MSAVKFVDLPAEGATGPRGNHALYSELRAQPGRWAEIARYPRAKRCNASSRGRQLVRRNTDLEYATRTVDDEVVLYLRAVAS